MTRDQLKEKIKRLTQFPFGKRDAQYQSYYLQNEDKDGYEYVKGSRDIKYRFDCFSIPNSLCYRSVLDLGCNLGIAAQEAYQRGAREVLGIDYEKDYIECAKDLAKFNNHNIDFLRMDLTKTAEIIKYTQRYFTEPDEVIDIVFMLAVSKHIGMDAFCCLIGGIKFKNLYVESSAAKDENTPHIIEMSKCLELWYPGNVIFGWTNDRSKRGIWRVNL